MASAIERSEALAWAAEVRRVRHETRARLHRGEISLDGVLRSAADDPVLGQAKLLWVLESLPGASKVATRRELSVVGIDGGVAIGSLSDATRAILVGRFPIGAERPAVDGPGQFGDQGR
jgi:hypothetical protein